MHCSCFFFDWIIYGWWTPQLLPIRLYVCVWNAANCYGQANVKRATTAGNCVFPADCKFSWKLNTNFWYMALALCCSRYCCLLTACNISNNISTFQHSPSSADKVLLRLPQDPAFPLLPAPFNVALCSGIYLFVFVRAAQLRLTLLTFYNMANTNTHAVPLPPTHTHTHSEGEGPVESLIAADSEQHSPLSTPLAHPFLTNLFGNCWNFSTLFRIAATLRC